MYHQSLPDSGGTMLKRLSIQRKLMAFLIVSCAAFSALVIGWSLTINGYQTKTEITIQSVDQAFVKQEFQVLLASTIRTKVTDSLLGELLLKTKKSVPLQSRILTNDLETLRKAILVQTLPSASDLKIQFSLKGIGTTDERVFLRNFTADFSDELIRLAKISAGNNKFVVQNTELARYRQVVDELENSVQHLKRRMVEVGKICGTRSPDSGPFRVASHRKDSRDLSPLDVRQLKETVSNIDLEVLDESTAKLKTLLDSFALGDRTDALPQAQPVGTPQPKQLFILSILALAFGMVVANHFKPFATQGFSSIAEVSNRLGIPVVAALPINQGHRIGSVPESTNDRKLPWANRLTRIATGWVWAVIVLTIGFCCFNQEIRETFFHNPVDGLARAVWYFKW